MATINVTDNPYNADGDGSTDDTSAIQSAIYDATQGDTVYIPSSSAYYKIKLPDPANDNGGVVDLSGNSIADDVAVEGDKQQTTVKLGSGHANNHQMFRLEVEDGVSGFRFRDMIVDGNRSNQATAPNVGHGFLATDGTSNAKNDTDVIVNNVRFQNNTGDGCSVYLAGTEIRNCDAIDPGHHGFAITCDEGPNTPKIKLKNLFASGVTNSSGKYAIDCSNSGNAVMEDCVALDCNLGTKTNDETIDATYRNIRISGCADTGFQRPDPGADTIGHPITVDNLVVKNAPGFGIRATAADEWYFQSGSEVVLTDCGDNKVSANWYKDNVTLSGNNATFYINQNNASDYYFDWSSSNSGTIGDLQFSGNTGQSLTNNGNLTILSSGNSVKTDISSVPNAEDVGAFVTTGFQLSGTVSGSSGGGVSGATVVAIEQDTANEFSQTTDKNGNYSFTGLATGTYHVYPQGYDSVEGKPFVDVS